MESTLQKHINDLTWRLCAYIEANILAMQLDGVFTITHFVTYSQLETAEIQVFKSSYQNDVISKAESILYRRGYHCKITMDAKRITYATRLLGYWETVLQQFVRLFKMCFLPFIMNAVSIAAVDAIFTDFMMWTLIGPLIVVPVICSHVKLLGTSVVYTSCTLAVVLFLASVAVVCFV